MRWWSGLFRVWFLTAFFVSSLRAETVVAAGGASLMSTCRADAPELVRLEAGTAVQVRSSIAGASPSSCYRVSAEIGGQRLDGYLNKDAFQDLDDFERARRDAALVGGSPAPDAGSPASQQEILAERPVSLDRGGSPVIEEALSLIDAAQPARALTLLEAELRRLPSGAPDPIMLQWAGFAAWRADNSRKALEYWRQSQEIVPDPDIDQLIARVEQEAEADQSTQQLVGGRVVLRYEGMNIPAETARQMMQVVDQEVARVSNLLGCRSRERLVAVAQSPEAYRATTRAPEWSGGRYDGRAIRVPVVENGAMDAEMRETLAHETVHACLRQLGSWPQWLNEGLAQSLSGRRLSSNERAAITMLAQAGQLPSLELLSGGWSGLNSASAQVAYAIGLRAVEILENDIRYGLRNLMNNPDQLPRLTQEIEKRMRE